jgi:hypothetical protein
MSCIKRLVVGVVMGNVLPVSLSGLSASLDITESKVQALLKAAMEAAARGEEVRTEQAKDCARVLKLSTYFRAPGTSWQVAVVLIGASIIDRLHWAVIGAPSRGIAKLSLSGLVDPLDSKVVAAMGSLLALLSSWGLSDDHDSDWRLLPFVGARDVAQGQLMTFARTTMIQLSAALFMKAEMRFASWPYRLQHLISLHTSAAQKAETAKAFLDASPCCLGPFGRQFRRHFGTAADLGSARCHRALRLWESLLKFSTSPVECEHKDRLLESGLGLAAKPRSSDQRATSLVHRRDEGIPGLAR